MQSDDDFNQINIRVVVDDNEVKREGGVLGNKIASPTFS